MVCTLCVCSGLTGPASSAPQPLLHCVFVTMAAGFDFVPGIFLRLFYNQLVFFVDLPFSALTLLVWRQGGIQALKKLGVGLLVMI